MKVRGVGTMGAVAAAWLAILVLAPSAMGAAPGVPRGYDVQRIDSPEPAGDANPSAAPNFGWGTANADLTGDGEQDLLVAQSQDSVPGAVFIFDGVTGRHIDTMRPPEHNDDRANNPEVLAFVYVTTMADLGSCSGGTSNNLCPNATIGLGDGIPEILVGSRALQVDPVPDGPRNASDPRIGRAYVIDGKTRAVLKRIDMPPGDRNAPAPVGPQGAAQFGRLVLSPQGLPACDGSSGPTDPDNVDHGVADCPSEADHFPRAVRIGDMDGGGQGDILVNTRGFRETSDTAFQNSQCDAAAPGTNCASAGRVYAYRGEDVVGTSPQEILDGVVNGNTVSGSGAEERVGRIQNPNAQTLASEFGGNMYRVGDGNLDGRPDIVIPDRNIDYPLRNPDATGDDVGAAYFYSGTTLWSSTPSSPSRTSPAPVATIAHPEQQARSKFGDSFNNTIGMGDMGASSAPDFVVGAPLQNALLTDQGRAWVFNGDPLGGGGGGEGSWQFATLDDPTPDVGGNFGASAVGVGELDADAQYPRNEVLIGGYGPFDPDTDASNNIIGDVHILNGATGRNLQTIVDPDREPGSGFGVGISPMGDLNDDGFLDFAVSAYLSDAPPGPGGQGRAFIFRSNDTEPVVLSGSQLSPGACANSREGTDGDDRLDGTDAGDQIFGLRGNDVINGLGEDDCLDGGRGRDRMDGGTGTDTLVADSGKDRLFGSDGDDSLFGGSDSDRLTAGQGQDLLAGGRGRDRLVARGGGRDQLFGEHGRDHLYLRGGGSADGGSANDYVNAANGERDTVNCGAGNDSARVDSRDRVRRCERVRRV
jgi:Ca2+-binding RTX toxin-like protein